MKGFAKLTAVAAIMAISTSAFAHRFDKLELKTNKNLKGRMVIDLSLRTAVGKSVKNLTIDTNDFNGEVIKVDTQNKNIKKIDYRIRLESRNNLPAVADTATAFLTGRIKLNSNGSNKIKRDKVQVERLKLGKKGIVCDNIVNVERKAEKLVLDLSNFVNLSSCSGNKLSEYTPSGIGSRRVDMGSNFYSIHDDIDMGADYARQFNAEYAHAILPKSHPMTVYLQRQMDKIANVADVPRTSHKKNNIGQEMNIRPKVHVVNADVLNAFALPGGNIYVFRGLLERAESIDSVMGVLGHEWAHVTARHGTKNVSRSIKMIYGSLIIYGILNIWADLSKDKVKKIVLPLLAEGARVGAVLAVLSKGREAELEADRLGSQYAMLAGFKPTGLAEMFTTFKSESGRVTNLEKILSSHPDHDTRIETNYMLSSLFYPAKNNDQYFERNQIEFEEAMSSLTDATVTGPIMGFSSSSKLANDFISGLKKQSTDMVMKEVEDYFGAKD